ncbi:MAG: hypothetical protein HY909_02115 [Deltaproteobacteria bacterium]|nr:hypothetical protein [Deltaproteobacteria bacterium]
MVETSTQGVQLLRAIALAVRSEQDYNLLSIDALVVGAQKRTGATPSDANDAKRQRGYAGVRELQGFVPLPLREALNKIAHSEPTTADFYVGPDDSGHDLLLYGTLGENRWFAVVSILRLVEVVRSLPDSAIEDRR